MFRYLSKIEIKQSIIYYLFLFLFFSFWNFFSLFSFYFYLNIQNTLQIYQDRLAINMLIFSEKNPLNIFNLLSEIEKIPHVKNIDIVSPEKLLEKVKKDLPSEILENFSEEELKAEFPYILKIYPLSIKDYPALKDRLNLLTKVNSNIQIYEPRFFKLIYYAYFFKIGFVIFVAIWIFFYIFFLYFLNNLLNLHLKNQTQIFLLLGGTLKKFKLLRFFFLVSVLVLAFGHSSSLFFFISDTISSIFPFFKHYPDISKEKDMLYFGIYTFFTIFLLPWLTILISYRNYEI